MSVIDIGAARRRTRPAAANSVRLTAAPAHGSTATDFSKSIIGTKSNLEHIFLIWNTSYFIMDPTSIMGLILSWDPTSIMGPKSIFRLGSTSLMGTHPNFSDKPIACSGSPGVRSFIGTEQ